MSSQIKNYSAVQEGLQGEKGRSVDLTSNIINYSVSPEGEEFPIPEPEEY